MSAPLPTPPTLGDRIGDLLAGLAKAAGPLVRDTVRLLCKEHEAGHVCVDLAAWQGRALDPTTAPFPDPPHWTEQLLASGVCCSAPRQEAPLPLVLDERGRLYLLRHHRDERRIVERLRQRLGGAPLVPAEALRAALEQLHWLPEGDSVDWQLAAIAAAASRRLAVITGGPGTGKTTTVARLLTLLLQLQPDLSIALAAPTGKAASRLGEALRARAAEQPQLLAAADAIATRTLHRLLGYLPLDDAFRFGKDQLLPHDLVVVDEVSMVDPALLAQLFEALRPDARLVLVGDRDQLAAVAAGQVLGDLCRVAMPERGVGARLGAYVGAATGMELPVHSGAPPIADAVIALRTNHRFADQPGIATFAQALARRDGDAAMAAFTAGHVDLQLQPDAEAALAAIAPALLAAAAAGEAGDAATALAHLASCRVLTATRHGPQGAEAWNRRIEALLRAHGHRVDEPYYQGRPVLVTVNDHGSQIWNGDLGVVAEVDGRRCVVFPTADGHREVSLLRLPAHETAWAMTVHKAQGSEFDEVLLAMPSVTGPLWQASLVYTGVTRARRRAIVCADPKLLDAGLRHWPQRSSGLADALADEAADD